MTKKTLSRRDFLKMGSVAAAVQSSRRVAQAPRRPSHKLNHSPPRPSQPPS
ncbi:MAG: twin-arginine translocation signal domain-containing protein [Roseiflexaceae bacterium]